MSRVDAPLLNRWLSLAATAEALLGLFDEHGWQMDGMHYGNLWNKLGRHLREHAQRGQWLAQHRTRMDRLADATSATLSAGGRLQAQPVANIAHGAAHAGIGGEAASRLFAALASAACALRPSGLSTFEPRHLANLAWGFATAGFAEPAFFAAVANVAKGRLGDFNEVEFAMVALAFGRAEHSGLSAALSKACARRGAGLEPQQLATTAQALVKMYHLIPPTGKGPKRERKRRRLRTALKRLSRIARPQLSRFNPADLDEFASAYAKWGHAGWGGRLTSAIARAGVEMLTHGSGGGGGKGKGGPGGKGAGGKGYGGKGDSGKGDSGKGKGYGGKGGGGKGDTTEWTPASPASSGAYPARHLANTIWAVAKLASACKLTSGAVDKRDKDIVELARLAGVDMVATPTRVNEFNARDLSNAAWAFLTLGLFEQKVMTAIAERSAAILPTFNAQECSKLLYAMSKADVRCAALETAAAAQREDRFSFDAPVGTVSLQHMKGGGRFARAGEREATGATAATGGALWEDAYVLAEWLARKFTGTLEHACLPLVPSASLPQNAWRGCTAVELGAGLGLCSVVAMRLGMRYSPPSYRPC